MKNWIQRLCILLKLIFQSDEKEDRENLIKMTTIEDKFKNIR